MIIKSKPQMYSLLRVGKLGNTLRTWDTLDAYLADGAPNDVALRQRQQGGKFIQHLTKAKVKKLWKPEFFISEHAPDHVLTLQGEVQQSPRHLDLFYSTVPNYTMRDGLLENGRHAYGLKARLILKSKMDPSSMDWLEEIWVKFPDSVIEFSCYPMSVGRLPNKNTLIWEVRTTY